MMTPKILRYRRRLRDEARAERERLAYECADVAVHRAHFLIEMQVYDQAAEVIESITHPDFLEARQVLERRLHAAPRVPRPEQGDLFVMQPPAERRDVTVTGRMARMLKITKEYLFD